MSKCALNLVGTKTNINVLWALLFAALGYVIVQPIYGQQTEGTVGQEKIVGFICKFVRKMHAHASVSLFYVKFGFISGRQNARESRELA